jgi:hypothetical protein
VNHDHSDFHEHYVSANPSEPELPQTASNQNEKAIPPPIEIISSETQGEETYTPHLTMDTPLQQEQPVKDESKENTDTFWYYLDRGNKLGPVSVSDITALFGADKIDRDTHVWNATMKEWKVITETELSTIFPQSLAPPIPAAQLNNNWIWVVALLPLIIEVLKQIIIVLAVPKGFPAAYIERVYPGFKLMNDLTPIAFFGINTALCWEDEKHLTNAGYNTKNMMWAAVFLVPAYLFWRANKVKQFPWYEITWIVALIFSIILQ